ncbi:SAM-dependent methyltransferase [Brachybacterium vulturis]|uniref:SAM-dependent methyltransferase n=1 Tax=Brachybacterium vulturis TaxID=2017484 RepID=A0A291GK56_9MICO|nr:methyltransferase domain-containing protein [Brachybacterium vulturis]ATG50601.1 SAM-dependent methyltransferase [Brachybacterium vulturis]
MSPSSLPGPAENLWTAALRRDPRHSRDHVERWHRFEAAGQDIHGEARLLDAMAGRGARVLDAGCGGGRLGGYLARAGHTVTGVDLDPHLIEVARTQHPGARWEVGNLAALDLPARFDLIVCAGNVLTFLSAAERRPALARLAAHLAPEGRLVVGFGLDRGYALEDFEADAGAAGLRLGQRFGTWDLRPADDDFLVGILTCE